MGQAYLRIPYDDAVSTAQGTDFFETKTVFFNLNQPKRTVIREFTESEDRHGN